MPRKHHRTTLLARLALAWVAVGVLVLTGSLALHLRAVYAGRPLAGPTAGAAQPSPMASRPSGARTPAPDRTSGSRSRLTARDGTDVAACRDSRCEIVVRRAPLRIPLAPRVAPGVFTVTTIRHGNVTFRSVAPNGAVTRLSTARGGRVSFGHVIVDVLAVRGHAAVLAFDAN